MTFCRFAQRLELHEPMDLPPRAEAPKLFAEGFLFKRVRIHAVPAVAVSLIAISSAEPTGEGLAEKVRALGRA